MRLVARLLAIVPFIAGMAWASIAAIDIARADALVREASTEMGTWAATRSRPALETWTSVNDRLQAARDILPTDPTNHELTGILKSSRIDSAERISESVSHLVKALELRPASPYTWANLAEAQYHRGEPGRTLELAFKRAVDLGPAEPGVQRTVANYGLAVWSEVSPATQALIDRVVGAGVRRNPLEMLQISEGRGRLDTACRHLVGQRTPDQRWNRLCQGREMTQ